MIDYELPEVTKKLTPFDEGAGVYVRLHRNHTNNKVIVNDVDITSMTASVSIEMSADELVPYVVVRLIAPEIVADIEGAAVDALGGFSLNDDVLKLVQELNKRE